MSIQMNSTNYNTSCQAVPSALIQQIGVDRATDRWKTDLKKMSLALTVHKAKAQTKIIN